MPLRYVPTWAVAFVSVVRVTVFRPLSESWTVTTTYF